MGRGGDSGELEGTHVSPETALLPSRPPVVPLHPDSGPFHFLKRNQKSLSEFLILKLSKVKTNVKGHEPSSKEHQNTHPSPDFP